ncbi:MAG: class I SAM-dependent methyltransferase [Burkholderiales bacterium]|jgi:S-adenosylmethionine-diacylgycerolhomoserine-N-methlytransferase|nr:class I SAM-dependent methyltransferase [Burkholderiales bacterium]
MVKTPLTAELRTLWQMARGAGRGASHAERLERFYRPQARHYDRFREKLLHGRRELVQLLDPPEGAVVIELGAGTGRNAEYFGERLLDFHHVELVDLCPSLLGEARRRWALQPRVRVIEADAVTYRPQQPADCVYLSYALTMMPAWRAALDNALAMLKPGGLLGIVDFGLPRGDCVADRCACAFWRRWFAHDGVHLDRAHVDTLQQLTETRVLHESTAALPYLPGLRVPYYIHVGRKPLAGDSGR